jgi:glycosyltransferase involved in cell wall biosynthesis
MNGKGMVSIIVPFFNAARFIRETVESVLGQTYDDWELLLIDDGSTDDSTRMARDWAAAHDRIFYLEHPGHENRGASMARNLGIEEARGEFIAFLDADDIWLPDKLERQVEIMSRHPEVALVFGASKYWYSWSDAGQGPQADEEIPLGVPADRVFEPPELLEGMLSGRTSVPCTCAILVRKDKAGSVGNMEGSFPSLFDDQVFYAKLFLAYPAYAYSHCDNLYRRHPDSMCARASETSAEVVAHRRYLHWVADYLSQQSIGDEDLWRVLARKIWLIGGMDEHVTPMGAWNRRRWVRKQCLRLERLLVPTPLRRRIWAKRIQGLGAPSPMAEDRA